MTFSRARTHGTLAALALAVVLSVPGPSLAGSRTAVERSKAPVLVRREPGTKPALVRDRLAATLLFAIITRRAPPSSK